MKLELLTPLIFAVIFFIVDIAIFIKMILLLKKMKNDTVENLGNKLNPYLHATFIISVLMVICMIIITIIK